MSSIDQKPHVICIPFPAQGHMNGMLQLAKLLHHKGFHITFVHTEVSRDRILSSRGQSSLNGMPGFCFEAIPDSLPLLKAKQDVDVLPVVRHNFADSFRDLVKRLNCSGPAVICVVSDFVTSFAVDVANEFGIPAVVFYSAGACGTMGFLKYKELAERGLFPLKSESDLTNGYLDTLVDWIPGMHNIRMKDLPTLFQTTDPDDVIFHFCKDEVQCSYRATAIILNTFDELESPVLDAMSRILPPMYTLGPLTLLSHHILDGKLKSLGSNLWVEDSSCISWLNEREAGSVIYVNYGSIAVLTNQQLVEFAMGLANSGQNFLWVIRPDLVKGETAVLPEGFLTETSGRGLLISWCLQEEVLKHPSVAGFLTHCGWNSVMESLSFGVPMLCWPFYADQQTNCRYLCNEWGVGMEVNCDVKREEVESMIRELMFGDKGKEIKRKALEWRETAVRSTESGGKSFLNLERVIKEVFQKKVSDT